MPRLATFSNNNPYVRDARAITEIRRDLLIPRLTMLSDSNPYFLKHRVIDQPAGDAIDGSNQDDSIFAGPRMDIIVLEPFPEERAEAVYGKGGNDTILGWDIDENSHDYYLDGGAGNDTIDGGNGSDWINGGIGNDSLLGGAGGDVLYGGHGHDTLDGGFGDDHLRSRRFLPDLQPFTSYPELNFDGHNTLNGGGGHDLIEGGLGNEIIYGDDSEIPSADGNDIIIAWSGDDIVMGRGGDDVIYGDYGSSFYAYPNATIAQNPTLQNFFRDGVINPRFFQEAQFEQVREKFIRTPVDIRHDGYDTLYGGTGNDTIYGEGGNDRIDGGSDRDYMAGGKGNDTYVVDDRNDRVVEESGTDTIEASVSIYRLNKHIENLTLMGIENLDGDANTLDNRVRGSWGHNTLWGNAGNDTLIGDRGDDVLVGASVYSATPLNEIDVLTGDGPGIHNRGRDTFVLGTSNNPESPGWKANADPRVLYDDGQRVFGGRDSYALITDFTNGEDRIQLRGRSRDYVLRSTTVVHDGRSISGTGVYRDELTDELIAVVEHGSGISAGQLDRNNSDQFIYV